MNPVTQSVSDPSPVAMPRPAVRAVLSVLFSLHLAGVFVAPLAASIMTAYSIFPNRESIYAANRPVRPEEVPAEPALGPSTDAASSHPGTTDDAVSTASVETVPSAESEAAETEEGDQGTEMPWLLDVLQPYLDVAYLNHGYNFFAPDPGPSHIVRYTAVLPDGSTIEGKFPDLKVHWPRLRYHRHFMLSEHSVGVLPVGTGEAYAKHILRAHGARKVTVQLIQHDLLKAEEVRAGKPLDAPDTFQTLATVTVTTADLDESEEASP